MTSLASLCRRYASLPNKFRWTPKPCARSRCALHHSALSSTPLNTDRSIGLALELCRRSNRSVTSHFWRAHVTGPVSDADEQLKAGCEHALDSEETEDSKEQLNYFTDTYTDKQRRIVLDVLNRLVIVNRRYPL